MTRNSSPFTTKYDFLDRPASHSVFAPRSRTTELDRAVLVFKPKPLTLNLRASGMLGDSVWFNTQCFGL